MNWNDASYKRDYVRAMFARIARRYDLMNRLMTFGQDLRWRRQLVRATALPPDGRFLDVATGTGDVAFLAAQPPYAPRLVVGLDLVPAMLQRAQRRGADGHPPPVWLVGEALHLPFASETFDAVASAFLLRNVSDVAAALREQARVTRRGGRVACLDVPRPDGTTLGQRLFRLYFRHVVPLLGRVITGDGDAYKYLPASAEAFLTRTQLGHIMESVGLDDVRCHPVMLGAVVICVAVKREARSVCRL
jgi:demethylmenaquinone methyltransferase/2-methoxy-6-polyprenyl-1,4-benzoquinol methylase